MTLRRGVSLLLVVIGLVLLPPAPSANACHASAAAHSGEEGFSAQAECQDEDAVGTDSSGTHGVSTSGITYSYEPVCIRGEGLVGDGFYGCGDQMECGQNGVSYHVWAHYPDGTSESLGEQCFDQAEVPQTQAAVTPALVLRAFRRIPLPASEMSVQPPGGKTLVNLETIFSTEAAEFSRTIGLLGRRVELEIWPSRFRWVAGDGREFVTDWAGRPWAKGVAMAEFITHLYEDAEAVTTRVDTTWSARYRVDGGPWREVGGVVTIEGEPFALEVLSAGPRLVG